MGDKQTYQKTAMDKYKHSSPFDSLLYVLMYSKERLLLSTAKYIYVICMCRELVLSSFLLSSLEMSILHP